MYLPRKYIFAHATFTSEQHGGVRGGYALAARENAQGLGGFRNDGLPATVACSQGYGLIAGNDAYEMLGLKGLDEKITRPRLKCLNREFCLGKSGHDHYR